MIRELVVLVAGEGEAQRVLVIIIAGRNVAVWTLLDARTRSLVPVEARTTGVSGVTAVGLDQPDRRGSTGDALSGRADANALLHGESLHRTQLVKIADLSGF